MNKHLYLVREFLEEFSFPLAKQGAHVQLSDMDIIQRQALLMEEGSEVLKAIKEGDIVEILLGFVELSYYSLGAIAMQGEEVMDKTDAWQHAGSALSVMRLLSDTINNCSSGTTESYSHLYSLCYSLSKGFINADFDKAFQLVHNYDMTSASEGESTIYGDAGKLHKEKPYREPDLSSCLLSK